MATIPDSLLMSDFMPEGNCTPQMDNGICDFSLFELTEDDCPIKGSSMFTSSDPSLQLELHQQTHQSQMSLLNSISSPITPLPQSNSTFSFKRSEMDSGFACPPTAKRPLLSNFDSGYGPKPEPALRFEPVTPSVSLQNSFSAATKAVSGMQSSVPDQPLSPVSESSFSDDEEASPEHSPNSPLPTPSRFVAARRRAQRLRIMKRTRARASSKEEISPVVPGSSLDSVVPASTVDEEEAESHLLDKKTARAIRNRQAAQRSRVEAKAKMQKLADDNDDLAVIVENLKRENADLQRQLQAILAHAFGNVQDINNVLSVFNRLKGSEGNVNVL